MYFSSAYRLLQNSAINSKIVFLHLGHWIDGGSIIIYQNLVKIIFAVQFVFSSDTEI